MAVPKRKTSKMKIRSRKAANRYKAKDLQISVCPETGQPHRAHRAHWHEGKLYYKGEVIMQKGLVETGD
ncbi:MAG: 50S ribosomal protein L32 [Verrucomicrobiota bacterium]|nr:50S ribosomal protein L32 [Verrucomicrobiota bacterium]